MDRASIAFVALGANLGDPALQIRQAIEAMAALPGTQVERASRLYRSPPWGMTDQPTFVNAVAQLRTGMQPVALLGALMEIERVAGRQRSERWGPRLLDLDLLVHGQVMVDAPGLCLPHPHLHERGFVLMPLAEIAPDFHVPGKGPVLELLRAVDCAGIEALG